MVAASLARRSGAWTKLVSSDIIEQVPLAYLVARQIRAQQPQAQAPDSPLLSRVAKQLDILRDADDATLKVPGTGGSGPAGPHRPRVGVASHEPARPESLRRAMRGSIL